MEVHSGITGVTMPAGEYWVGDPCYAIQTDGESDWWMQWLQAADYTNQPRFLAAYVGDHPVVGVSTAHGDGVYIDRQGRNYPVDAGLIGAVPVALAKDEPFGMTRMTFDQDFLCTYEDGVIVIGDVHINTDWEDE